MAAGGASSDDESGGVRTTCPYCGVGCGVIATPDGAGGAAIAGDPDHPANFGRLCSKGAALGETLGLDRRLLRPRVDGAGADWPTAIGRVADAFARAIAEHGPDSVAIYGSGQLLTEDYYVANKLMKGFIGSANMDTNSRLCMASSVAGQRSAFGADVVPGVYADLEEADAVVLVGSNLAWCHPVLYQRLQSAHEKRPNLLVVNVDPRRTATSDLADLEMPIRAGTDVALFGGLLAEIERRGLTDRGYLTRHVGQAEPALAAVRGLGLKDVAAATGLTAERIRAFYDIWIGRERVVTVFSQGVNQSVEGVRKVQAILNCHLATGRIGRPGMGPFSVTGQPNAMGGREVGGLANMLAAHLELENPVHRAAVQDFWGSPRIAERPGLKAVDLFRACADGEIKALWVMATNPAVSMPDAAAVRAAIRATPFVAVSEMSVDSDTLALADVALPALGWGEKSGTVTNSERRVSRQRRFLPAPGEARPDWRIVSDVAAAMGFGAAFDYAGPADIFREHAALSAVAAGLGRDFDIGRFGVIDKAAYDALQPTLWPAPAKGDGPTRFFADGGFFTEDGKACMNPTAPAAPSPLSVAFRLNTGRTRDHWHTMTRTGVSPRLSQHNAEPFLEINPADAHKIGVAAAELARVENDQGSAILRVLTTDRVAPGAVFAPMHWSAATAGGGVIGDVSSPATDPVSGQPDLKGALVRIRPFQPAWYGFAVSRAGVQPGTAYWAKARTESGWRVELADMNAPEDWEAFARALFGASEDWMAVGVQDPRRGDARIAFTHRGRVEAALLAGPTPVAAARAHIVAALGADASAAALLAGRPAGDAPNPGATVCACFGVGVNAIVAAIAGQRLTTVAQIGEALQAGTNCGSCRPELKALLAGAPAAAAE